MPSIVVGSIQDFASLDRVSEAFSDRHPDMRLGAAVHTGEGVLRPSSHGIRYVWIESGTCEALVPSGYRTQEGDGNRLPEGYAQDPFGGDLQETLATIEQNFGAVDGRIQQPVAAILDRRLPTAFIGDISGELWLIMESGLDERGWSDNPDVRASLRYLFRMQREIGWSTKRVASWEEVRPGDQIAVSPGSPVHVRGEFRYWWIEDLARQQSHVSTFRRLRYLRDTAGGCNFAFDAFRRLPMTWDSTERSQASADGVNRVNSHIVNIAEETSQTHYHPQQPIGGGTPQSEFYLVLDPAVVSLDSHGREPLLHTYPDVDNLSRFHTTHLHPGATVYIPPGTGHRGIDVFVNVVTVPGFKPRNEVYIDGIIKEQVGEKAPYNARVVGQSDQSASY